MAIAWQTWLNVSSATSVASVVKTKDFTVLIALNLQRWTNIHEHFPLIWKAQPFRHLYIVIIQLWHKLNLIGSHIRLYNSSSEWAYIIIKLMLTGCCRQCQLHKNPRKNSLDFGGLLYPVQHMDCIIYMNCTINPGLYHNGVIDWDARHHIRSAQRSASRHLSVAISRCNPWLVEPRISLYSRLSVPWLISAPEKKQKTLTSGARGEWKWRGGIGNRTLQWCLILVKVSTWVTYD